MFRPEVRLTSSLFLVGGLWFLLGSRAIAQSNIVLDQSLGAESSQVVPNVDDVTNEEIQGGARRGTNLFHSFKEFNIGQGNSAYFNTGNSPIANIFARVTGRNQSEILGKLGTRGVSDANLFLINPNGIFFGPEGELDVDASFIGTTANAIQFNDQSIFSASEPNQSTLVRVQPSALLFNRINSGTIENQSTAGFLDRGLDVPFGRNLLLVGGDVRLNGGNLSAFNGRIELGGIKSTGTIGLNLNEEQFLLDFPEDTDLANVTLDNQAKVSVSSNVFSSSDDEQGRISITAKELKLNDASEITAGIGTNQDSLDQPSIGTAIRIQAESLQVQGGSIINTDILGAGNSGDIEIRAQNILLDGQEFSEDIEDEGSGATDRSSKITNRIDPDGQGVGGNIRIDTGSLTIQNGAFISTSTDTFEVEGIPGDISITARDKISLIGVGTDVPSTISSQVFTDAKGDAGSINLTVTEGSLDIRGGANINTSTNALGNTGNIKIDVRDGIRIDGTGELTKDIFGNPIQPELSLKQSGIFSTILERGQGSPSIIQISSETLDVTNGAQIAVNSVGTGQAGDIKLISSSLTLDGGTISAETASNLGGNIELDIDNLLLLRNKSLISATAGTNQTRGDGGNINIDTALLVAFPFENSDITANAFEGTGGNIQITAQGVFGTEFRNQLTPSSDITASSNFGTDGTVQLDTSLDPTSGLVDLPVQPPQPQQVAQTCTPGDTNAQSEFVYTGRGGLPPTAQQVLNQPEIEADWVSRAPHIDQANQNQSQPRNISKNKVPAPSVLSQRLSSDSLSLSKGDKHRMNGDALSLSTGDKRGLSEAEAPSQAETEQNPTIPTKIVEAQGWTSTDDGKVMLTSSTTTTPHHLSQKVCPSS